MQKRSTRPSILALLCLLVVNSSDGIARQFSLQFRSPTAADLTVSQKSLLIQQVTQSQVITLQAEQIEEILRLQPRQIAVSFPAEIPMPRTITLDALDIFTPEAKTIVRDDRGDHEIPFRSQWASYIGKVPGEDRSMLVLNVSRLGVNALFEFGGKRYCIREASFSGEARPHLFFPEDAFIYKTTMKCGVQGPGESPQIRAMVEEIRARQRAGQIQSAQPQLKKNNDSRVQEQLMYPPDMFRGAISPDTIEVRVALEGDNDLVVTTGSVDSAMNLMVSTAAYASAVYLREVNVKLTVPYARVWQTATDPYGPEIFTALSQFASYWAANMDTVGRTTAHLFVSSKNWQSVSGVAGIARLNTLCNKIDGYGVTDVRSPATLAHLMTFTHELGHNFGSYHTHSCLWPNGPIDHCSEIEGGCYSGALKDTVGTIMSYCTSRNLEFGPIPAALIRRTAEVSWCSPSTRQVAIATTDSAFLQSLYSSAGGTSWTNRTNWTGPVVGRYGIAVRNGRVVSIDLVANNLQGTFPTGFTNLTELRRLNLSGRNRYHLTQVAPPDPPTDRQNLNRLTGTIPTTLNQLTKLEFLDLSNNLLTGGIPSSIGSLTSLYWLNLSENFGLGGTIPTSLAGLTKIEVFDLSRDGLSGGIPSELGSLSNVRYLTIAENGGLGGTIPTALGNLSKVQGLFMFKCGLTGSIPTQMGNLTQLVDLDLSTNQLTGSIPDFSNAKGFQNLTLSENQLTGSIPASLATLQKMVGLRLMSNKLSGSLAPELGNMNLWSLFLGKNQLTGAIPLSFGKLTQVVEFDLSENQLTGTIPDTLRQVGSNFYPGLGGFFEFDVNDNKLTGSFPDWLGQMSQFGTISTLKLGGNKLDVTTIPTWIFTAGYLGRLWLHDIGFTGTISTEFSSLTSLFELKLSGNQLTGSIPAALGNLTNLQTLWLQRNQLTGTVPTAIGNFASMQSLRLSENQLTGAVPSGVGTMNTLVELGLNDNNFDALPANFTSISLKQAPTAFVAIENNKFSFASINPLVSLGLRNFTYAPQKPAGSATLLELSPGGTANMSVTVGGTGNTYQWYKNKVAINGATSSTYSIASVAASDTATYTVQVKNTGAPLLTIEGGPFIVTFYTAGFPHTISLLAPATGTGGLTNPVSLKWSKDALSTSYHVHVDTSQAFNSPALIKNEALTDTSFQLPALLTVKPYYWRVRGVNNLGVGTWSETRNFRMSSTVNVEDVSGVPREFQLSQNYPNPFNPSTTIGFALPQSGFVTLKVYNLLGQEVATLVEQFMAAGSYRVQWDAKRFNSGIYVYRMTAGTFESSKTLLMIK